MAMKGEIVVETRFWAAKNNGMSLVVDLSLGWVCCDCVDAAGVDGNGIDR